MNVVMLNDFTNSQRVFKVDSLKSVSQLWKLLEVQILYDCTSHIYKQIVSIL